MRKLLLSIVGAVVLIAVTMVPADATYRGRNGQIAFVPEYSYGAPSEIWTADSDGSNAVKLVEASSPAGYHCAGWFSGTGSGPKWSRFFIT